MCDYPECLADGAISTVYERDPIKVIMGRIDGRPFSGLIVDTRSGQHLHFPWSDVAQLTRAKVQS